MEHREGDRLALGCGTETLSAVSPGGQTISGWESCGPSLPVFPGRSSRPGPPLNPTGVSACLLNTRCHFTPLLNLKPVLEDLSLRHHLPSQP